MNQPSKKSVEDVKKFISDSGADRIVEEIKLKLTRNGSLPVYSDIYKVENGRTFQYVNYVQEGGGVLGVALAGYTYVLEKLGFRFLKLAGTSAGAINTMMLASIEKENYPELKESDVDTQSEIIVYEMLNKNLWELVDGSRFGKWIIRMSIYNKRRLGFLISLLKYSIAFPLMYAVFQLIQNAFSWPLSPAVNSILDVIAVTSVVILILYIIIILIYLAKFSKAHFGINPGNDFYDWMKSILEKNKIRNTSDLENLMEKRFAEIKLRDHPDRTGLEKTTVMVRPYITIITSDTTNQIKVEFPKMAEQYWTSTRFAEISPACFVRASMSIPVFFAPFRITVDESVIEKSFIQQSRLVAKQFYKAKSIKPETHNYQVYFVDGGILSNFPMSVFHNPQIKIARMPTFGVRLEDEKHVEGEQVVNKKLKFFPYLYKIFNTVRFNYDKDFLSKNAVYEQCIGHIDVEKFNWLDFGLGDNIKSELFLKGAEAAKTFFLGGEVWIKGRKSYFEPFDWEKYKSERAKI